METITTTYTVTGMTCGHCVAAVSTEVGQIDGVTSVEVELVPEGTSLVKVSGSVPADGDAVGAAVDEDRRGHVRQRLRAGVLRLRDVQGGRRRAARTLVAPPCFGHG